MELNLFTIVYLFFRLAPFIIVCFFTLQSVFNQDLRGIIYLVGLIFACVFTTMVGSIPGFQYIVEDYGEKMPANVKQVCRLIELANGAPISYIPLGQAVLAYTFIYLVYIIVNHNLIMQNIPTLVIFPTLIVADMIWNVANSCSSVALLFLSLILGGGIGALWAYIIDSTGKADLQLFNGISSQSVCSRPSKQILRCRPKGDLSLLAGGGGGSATVAAAPPPPLINPSDLTSAISQYLIPPPAAAAAPAATTGVATGTTPVSVSGTTTSNQKEIPKTYLDKLYKQIDLSKPSEVDTIGIPVNMNTIILLEPNKTYSILLTGTSGSGKNIGTYKWNANIKNDDNGDPYIYQPAASPYARVES